MSSHSERESVGVVAIGRNEGERLQRCLDSVLRNGDVVVYVDSGSTDGSVEMALAKGASVVNLDMSRPFTAARARNEGFRRMQQLAPQAKYVQFVDGDCEVAASWMLAAVQFLESHPNVAGITGRRRELYPQRSVYNWLTDLDWRWPTGKILAFGGDALLRVAALEKAGGYRDDLIAGEEPELCVRLRAAGWQIWSIPEEMTAHDANMTRFGQWWRRTIRTGFAYAEGAHLHGAPPERHWVRESRSGWAWGVALPALVIIAALLIGPLALLGFLIYPLQVLRLSAQEAGPLKDRLVRSWFVVLAKFPQVFGQIKFLMHHMRGRRAKLIEYK